MYAGLWGDECEHVYMNADVYGSLKGIRSSGIGVVGDS